MEKLGVWLRQTREAQGSALAEAETSTRIRAYFLELLEAGDFAALPGGEVQVRGFLRIYARYLDLPPEEVLARYDAERHGPETSDAGAPSAPAKPAPFQPRAPSISLPRLTSLRTPLIVAIALVSLLVIVATVNYFFSHRSNERSTVAITATAPAETALSPTATPMLPIITPTFPANPDGKVTLTLEATEHVWVRVMRDARTVFEDMMAPGQTETWSGREAIVVETGNGAGLQVTVNGQPQGALCGCGEVCARAWGPAGELNVLSIQ